MTGARFETWSAEMVDTLRDLWPDKSMTCALIAEVIYQRHGRYVGKNGVVGKSRRLRLPSRPSVVSKRGDEKTPRPRQIRPKRRAKSVKQSNPSVPNRRVSRMPVHVEEQFTIFDFIPCTFMENVERKGCWWPIGPTLQPTQTWCGRPRADGSKSFCAHHHAMAYIPTQKVAPSLALADRLPYEMRRRA